MTLALFPAQPFHKTFSFREDATMVSTLEQSAAQLNTTQLPSVTYDVSQKKISVTVIVSKPSGSTDLTFDAPIFGVPGSGSSGVSATWTVTWTVVPGDGLDSVSFNSPGIVIPAAGSSLPDRVSDPVDTEAVPESSDQWQATIVQQVTDVNAFSYTLSVTGDIGGTLILDSHDPTIVVTLDPMG
jgi:hypothetical protein